MKAIHQMYTIHAVKAIIWQALVNPKVIARWGAGPAKMNDKDGAEFSLWGGEIWGKNIKIIKEKKLVQEWHDDHETNGMVVTITLEEKGDKTILTLLHENVPNNKYSDLSKGWREFYLEPLKKFVEEQTTPA